MNRSNTVFAVLALTAGLLGASAGSSSAHVGFPGHTPEEPPSAPATAKGATAPSGFIADGDVAIFRARVDVLANPYIVNKEIERCYEANKSSLNLKQVETLLDGIRKTPKPDSTDGVQTSDRIARSYIELHKGAMSIAEGIGLANKVGKGEASINQLIEFYFDANKDALSAAQVAKLIEALKPIPGVNDSVNDRDYTTSRIIKAYGCRLCSK